MRADGGEAVEVRKHEGLAEGTNEEVTRLLVNVAFIILSFPY